MSKIVQSADVIEAVRGIVGEDRSFVVIMCDGVDEHSRTVSVAAHAVDAQDIASMCRAAIDPALVEVPFGALLTEN